jgi:hypothetical protein
MIAMEKEIQKSMIAPTLVHQTSFLWALFQEFRALHHPTFSGL